MLSSLLSFYICKQLVSILTSLTDSSWLLILYFKFEFTRKPKLDKSPRLRKRLKISYFYFSARATDNVTLSLKRGLTSNCDLSNCSDEIAGCIEKAYEQIQFSEATRVLFFSSPKKMTDYAKKVWIFLLNDNIFAVLIIRFFSTLRWKRRQISILTIYFYLQRGWSLSADGYYSFSSQQQRAEEVTIPSTELAQQVIEYARQLEMIV